MVRQMSQSDLVQHPESTRGACISAVEMACWDLMGHQLGQPIHVMLGGAHRQRLRGYTYLHETPAQVAEGITRSQIWADPKLAAESARRTVGSGWSAIKLDPIGFPPGRRLPFDPSAAEIDQVRRVLAAVREAVGPRVDIMLGTHGQFTVSGAIRVARAVEEFDPAWFEEPIPPEDPALMARVAEATTIPIAAGERLVSIHDFAALLRVSGASILNIHTGRCGGILEARKIAILAEAAHASIAPHLWAGELVAASAIQVGAASPNFMIQECIGDFSGNYASGILKEPIRVENGYIHLPEGPGLGVEIREDVVRQLSVNC
jgi:L-alanine-DL-glutamate epimerase-like enolase superfamily enzyme